MVAAWSADCVAPENIHSPTKGGNCKFRRGEGSKAQEIPGRRGGWMINLVCRSPSIQHGFKCQSSCSKIRSYLLSRTFIWKNSGLYTCIWIGLYRYLKYIFFLQNALWKLTNAKNVPLRGNGCHYLLPVHMESPFRQKNTRSSGDFFREN